MYLSRSEFTHPRKSVRWNKILEATTWDGAVFPLVEIGHLNNGNEDRVLQHTYRMVQIFAFISSPDL